MLSYGKMQTRAQTSAEKLQPQLFSLEEFLKHLEPPCPALLPHA